MSIERAVFCGGSGIISELGKDVRFQVNSVVRHVFNTTTTSLGWSLERTVECVRVLPWHVQIHILKNLKLEQLCEMLNLDATVPENEDLINIVLKSIEQHLQMKLGCSARLYFTNIFGCDVVGDRSLMDFLQLFYKLYKDNASIRYIAGCFSELRTAKTFEEFMNILGISPKLLMEMFVCGIYSYDFLSSCEIEIMVDVLLSILKNKKELGKDVIIILNKIVLAAARNNYVEALDLIDILGVEFLVFYSVQPMLEIALGAHNREFVRKLLSILIESHLINQRCKSLIELHIKNLMIILFKQSDFEFLKEVADTIPEHLRSCIFILQLIRQYREQMRQQEASQDVLIGFDVMIQELERLGFI